jgi:Spy/CpxP family protein refolding chaperone
MSGGFVQKALFALVFLGLGSVGTLAGSALATPGGGPQGGGQQAGGRGGGKAAMVEKLVQDLNLSPEQMAKGEEVKERVSARMKDMRQQRKAGFEELANELSSGPVDRKAVHKLADRRLDTMSNNIHASIDDILDFVDTLDPQQKETLVNDLRTIKSGSGSRRGARGSGAPVPE